MRDFRSLEQKIRQVWLDEAEARNTAARKKVENVGRPQDDNKDPETSKLAKQGEIKTKIIDEEKHRVAVTVSEPDHPMVTKRKEHKQKFVKVSGDKESSIEKAKEYYKKAGYKVHGAEYHSLVNEVTLDIGPNTGPNEEAEDNQKEKDPKKITGGKTEVILDPKTDDRPEEQTMEDEKQKKTVKQENKKIGAKSGVKEEVDLDEAGRILPDLTQTEPKPQHSKEYQAKIDREKSNRAIAKKERAKFNEFKRYSFRRWMATQDGSK